MKGFNYKTFTDLLLHPVASYGTWYLKLCVGPLCYTPKVNFKTSLALPYDSLLPCNILDIWDPPSPEPDITHCQSPTHMWLRLPETGVPHGLCEHFGLFGINSVVLSADSRPCSVSNKTNVWIWMSAVINRVGQWIRVGQWLGFMRRKWTSLWWNQTLKLFSVFVVTL